MNKELQKTICEQLPYGLKMSDGRSPYELTFDNVKTLSKYCQPILRRMDLTKPITHGGNYIEDPISYLYHEVIGVDRDCFGTTDQFENFLYGPEILLPMIVTDWLNKMHFNWRGIPDELVKYTDEFETDPYV